jgi:hypothetical protein
VLKHSEANLQRQKDLKASYAKDKEEKSSKEKKSDVSLSGRKRSRDATADKVHTETKRDQKDKWAL